jgi:hypothetical protein
MVHPVRVLLGRILEIGIRSAGHVAPMGEMRIIWKTLARKTEGKKPPGRSRYRCENNIRVEILVNKGMARPQEETDPSY